MEQLCTKKVTFMLTTVFTTVFMVIIQTLVLTNGPNSIVPNVRPLPDKVGLFRALMLATLTLVLQFLLMQRLL